MILRIVDHCLVPKAARESDSAPHLGVRLGFCEVNCYNYSFTHQGIEQFK